MVRCLDGEERRMQGRVLFGAWLARLGHSYYGGPLNATLFAFGLTRLNPNGPNRTAPNDSEYGTRRIL